MLFVVPFLSSCGIALPRRAGLAASLDTCSSSDSKSLVLADIRR